MQTLTRPPAGGAAARRLTTAEKQQFAERGYVKNLPLFDEAGVAALQTRFDELLARVPDGEDINSRNNWHKANRWCYDLCQTPAIHDYVEDLLGPDLIHWGCQFFCKLPGASSEVPWHQDSQYWPLTPRTSVTLWLALYDTDDTTGAMRVVAASHRADYQHHTVEGDQYTLAQAIDEQQFDPADIVTIDLKAGEASIHDDDLVHGSGPSESGRRRVGMTLRFSPTDVRCDVEEWPFFEAYLVRGTDRFQHNPVGKVPSGDAIPTARFQPSSDFP